MAYPEWCPICKELIITVTRGIPSMGYCQNGHSVDRRDVLLREPEKTDPKDAVIAALRTQLAEAENRAEQAEIERDHFHYEVKLRNRIPATSDVNAKLLARAEAAEAERDEARASLKSAEEYLVAARDMALEEAANVKRPDISRRYCTNDEAFFNEGFDAAVSAIRKLKGEE